MAAIHIGDRAMLMLVDDADVAMLSGFLLRPSGDGRYVRADRGRMLIAVHRLIAGAGPDDVVDHINNNGWDNRTANLRLTNSRGNSANRGPDRRRLGTTSRHKGVSWNKDRDKWQAYLHTMGKTRFLGRFDDEDDAARAYNAAARQVWGDMARLNIVGEVMPSHA